MAFSNKFMNNSPFKKEEPKKEEPKNEDNLEYTTKSKSGMSDAEYAKYFGEGSIHTHNLDPVDLGIIKANKKIGESSIVDTSKGSSFPTGASTETLKKWYANNPPRDTIRDLSAENKNQGKASIIGNKESLENLKTIVGNPFDAARAILRTDDSGGDFPTSIKDLRALRALADRDDGSESSEQAKSILSRSSGFNVASAMVGPALTAQTFVDLVTGDPTAAILGKAKKLKPIKKALKKSKAGRILAEKVLPTTYLGYKTKKQSKKI